MQHSQFHSQVFRFGIHYYVIKYVVVLIANPNENYNIFDKMIMDAKVTYLQK